MPVFDVLKIVSKKPIVYFWIKTRLETSWKHLATGESGFNSKSELLIPHFLSSLTDFSVRGAFSLLSRPSFTIIATATASTIAPTAATMPFTIGAP